ncbi:MAG: type III-B CRISPR module-associated Cmr3 family protein [Bacteroidota bacterium]
MTRIEYTHLITLRPIDVFFFGSERTFGNDELVNYRAETRLYPQQTTLMGLLRYIGYYAEGIGPKKIGCSFTVDSFKRESNYGVIKAISPLFFRKYNDQKKPTDFGFAPYLRVALTKSPPKVNELKAEYSTGTDDNWHPLIELPDYIAKDDYEVSLVAVANEPIDLSDVVKTDERVGITKQLEDTEKSDGFYKQKMGRLVPGFSFAFMAKLELGKGKIPKKQVIKVGAEKALFSVSCKEIDEKESKTYTDRIPADLYDNCRMEEYYVAVLLSDAFVERKPFERLAFTAAGTVDFRHLHTPSGVRKNNWGKLDRSSNIVLGKGTIIQQSKKYNLLSRGSLLTSKSRQDLIKLLDQHHWQTIGCNQYHLLDPLKSNTQ